MIGLFYCSLTFLAFPFLAGFSNNFGSGALQPKTESYLKVRIYGVYAYFAAAVVIPILFSLYALLIVDGRTRTYTNANGTTGTITCVFDKPKVFALATAQFIGLLLNAWFELNLQKSLQEASNVISGSISEQAKAQVL